MDMRVGLERKLSAEELMFWTVVLKKMLESPLDRKEIQPVNLKGNQPWIFTGRTDAEAQTPILGPPDAKSWLTGKDPDAGKDWRWEEKGTTEDEMVGWHHRLDGHEFEHALGAGDGQGSLACCGPWGHKDLDTTELLNWRKCEARQPGVDLLLTFMNQMKRKIKILSDHTYTWTLNLPEDFFLTYIFRRFEGYTNMIPWRKCHSQQGGKKKKKTTKLMPKSKPLLV